jgi:hypothetical protein
MQEIKVYTNLGLIGDAICGMPFLHDLSKTYNVIAGPNISKWVLEGVDFPVAFDPNLNLEDADYHLDSSLTWQACSRGGNIHHMAQGHYLVNGLTIPRMPLSIPLKFQQCNLEPGIVISPFSRSDHQGNKFWDLKNWLELINHFPDPVYVVGSSQYNNDKLKYGEDSWDWITATKIRPVINKPMSYISSLLKSCKMLVSIDTGTSHLAHMLGMSNHALLYSPAVPPNFVRNPHAITLVNWPKRVTVQDMLHLCKRTPGW